MHKCHFKYYVTGEITLLAQMLAARALSLTITRGARDQASKVLTRTFSQVRAFPIFGRVASRDINFRGYHRWLPQDSPTAP